MNIRKIYYYIILLFLVVSCQRPSSPALPDKFKAELFAVEKEFCLMAQTDGIQKAFVHFAADSAVIIRGQVLVKGKEAIHKRYEINPNKGGKLIWSADFADVSASGDLGYTYGKYIYTEADSLGRSTESTGIFHTVWKRQNDGQWRFVWD